MRAPARCSCRWRLTALVAAVSVSSAAAGEDCVEKDRIGFREIAVRFENDLFVSSDRNYTNGVLFSAVTQDLDAGLRPECLPAPVRLHAELIRRFDRSFWDDAGSISRGQNVVVKLGQSMYTPGDPSRRDLIANDRPYAGLLYVGLSWNRRLHDPARGSEKLDTREIQLGVIGPPSLAREAQKMIHDLRDFPRFEGWGNQLRTEPAIQIVREQKYRRWRGDGRSIPGFSGDVIRSVSVGVGNIETSIGAAIEGRVGWNLPNDFGTYPVRPAAENRPPAPAGRGGAGAAGVALFALLEAKAVLHQFALDGNLLRASHSVERRPLVALLAVGASARAEVLGRGATFSVMRVMRSREFEGQGRSHAYGSFSLSIDL